MQEQLTEVTVYDQGFKDGARVAEQVSRDVKDRGYGELEYKWHTARHRTEYVEEKLFFWRCFAIILAGLLVASVFVNRQQGKQIDELSQAAER